MKACPVANPCRWPGLNPASLRVAGKALAVVAKEFLCDTLKALVPARMKGRRVSRFALAQ